MNYINMERFTYDLHKYVRWILCEYYTYDIKCCIWTHIEWSWMWKAGVCDGLLMTLDHIGCRYTHPHDYAWHNEQ